MPYAKTLIALLIDPVHQSITEVQIKGRTELERFNHMRELLGCEYIEYVPTNTHYLLVDEEGKRKTQSVCAPFKHVAFPHTNFVGKALIVGFGQRRGQDFGPLSPDITPVAVKDWITWGVNVKALADRLAPGSTLLH